MAPPEEVRSIAALALPAGAANAVIAGNDPMNHPANYAANYPANLPANYAANYAATDPVNCEANDLAALASPAAYEAFLADARALAPREIVPGPGAMLLIYQQVKSATDRVLQHDAFLSRVADLDVYALRSLPALARGLAWASILVCYDADSAAFGPLLSRAHDTRRRLLRAAEALVEAEVIPAAALDSIAEPGRRDVIADCGALIELFRRYERKLSGRTHVTRADIAEAEETVAALSSLLAAPGAEAASLHAAAATQMRDRFWSLLNRRYDLLWRCGALLFGPDVDLHVPPLLSSHRARRPATAAANARVLRSGDPGGRSSSETRRSPRPSLPGNELHKSRFRFWIQASTQL